MTGPTGEVGQSTTTGEAAAGVACVWLAAGSGSRMENPVNKVFLPLAGRAVVTRSIEATLGLPDVIERILVAAERDLAAAEALLSRDLPFPIRYVTGGSSRHESEWNALQRLAPEIEASRIGIVLIHDAARPLAQPQLFADVIEAARAHGGALPVRPAPPLISLDSAVAAAAHAVVAVQTQVVTVQTPQAFQAHPLLDAHRRAARVGFVGTDTASCVERFSDLRVRCLPGHDANIKITYAEDLALAERLFGCVMG